MRLLGARSDGSLSSHIHSVDFSDLVLRCRDRARLRTHSIGPRRRRRRD